MKRLVLIIILLMSVTASSVVSAVTEPATESFSITAELDSERALTSAQKEQISKFVDLSSTEKAQINATVSLTSETDWNISGDFFGLRITDRIILSGNYEKVKLEDGSIIFYGCFIDEQMPGGMYMYCIPSQDKILITYNIHTDNEQAVFTFGSSFKEIEEVVTFEKW